MRLCLALALVIAAPALAADQPPEPPPFDGLQGRMALSQALVADLIDQYALTATGIDVAPDIPLVPRDTLHRWTLPVIDDAAAAVWAMERLQPDLADPLTLEEVRAAITDVQDNLAWDEAATVDGLRRLAGHMNVLAATLQQAAMPPEDPSAP
ncbi:MAG: hypothetical protein WCZ23_11570 [Rhodospirillaceae bacterium]